VTPVEIEELEKLWRQLRVLEPAERAKRIESMKASALLSVQFLASLPDPDGNVSPEDIALLVAFKEFNSHATE
jgi:hypothetical protein